MHVLEWANRRYTEPGEERKLVTFQHFVSHFISLTARTRLSKRTKGKGLGFRGRFKTTRRAKGAQSTFHVLFVFLIHEQATFLEGMSTT